MGDALPETLLLDMDDTILADTFSVEPCWRGACAQYAARYAPLTAEAIYTAINVYRDWFWSDRERHRRGRLALEETRREIVAGGLRQLGLDDPMLALNIAQTYATLRAEAMQPFPGVLDTLRALRERGVKLGLLTNGNARLQREKIEKHGLAPFFDCLIIEGEFGVGKPDARVYQHALTTLGAVPPQTWMVGDNLEWDVAGAQCVGITGIWLDWAGAGLPANCPTRPNRIIRSVTELLDAQAEAIPKSPAGPDPAAPRGSASSDKIA